MSLPARLAIPRVENLIDGYFAGGFADLSDTQLAEVIALAVSRPKVARASSFVLHAPLELLARAALLPMVEPAAREAARQRLLWLGAAYKEAGEEVPEPAPRSYDQPAEALAAFRAALNAGDSATADAAAAWLAAVLTPSELAAALADDILPRLSAAAHGSIFLFQLPRVAPRSAAIAGTLRGLVRELLAEPDWKLSWYQGRTATPTDPGDLVERLRRPRSPGNPGSPFIYPVMSLVESSGLALETLDAATYSLDVRSATRILLRVAAWSMLQDNPQHAPYGWSHCLTMPQAVLGIASTCAQPRDAVAVAATYVLGFRATQGSTTLDPQWSPAAPTSKDALALLDGEPALAAAGVWHAPPAALSAITARLATRAALHQDAHLAKYTHACFDAASADPAAARLYLAAAAYLSAWWAQRPQHAQEARP